MSSGLPPGEINPYASPTVVNSPVPLDAGIGVWRDGHLIVMHQDSRLPACCVKSGIACRTTSRVEVFPSKLSEVPLRIAVPLAAWWRHLAVYCREYLWLFGIVVIFSAIGLSSLMQWLVGNAFMIPDMLVAGMLFIAITAFGMLFGSPLDCVRSDGPYLWLRGASPRFLEKLPDWDA